MESSEVINAGKNEEEEVDIDLNDPDVANAAVKIQAGFRAHIKAKKSDTAKVLTPILILLHAHVRTQNLGGNPNFFSKKKKEFSNFPFCLLILYPVFLLCPTQSSVTRESSPVAVAEQESEEVIDIDLNDPEVEKAALKIQAGFKGFRKAKKATTQV